MQRGVRIAKRARGSKSPTSVAGWFRKLLTGDSRKRPVKRK
jgi:hypothetical protein